MKQSEAQSSDHEQLDYMTARATALLQTQAMEVESAQDLTGDMTAIQQRLDTLKVRCGQSSNQSDCITDQGKNFVYSQ